MSSECWVYRAYHALSHVRSSKRPDGVKALLYVGISDTPATRMSQHESAKWWWWLVNSIEWTKFDTRDLALLQESNAITYDRPIFNKSQSTLKAANRLNMIIWLLWHHERNIRSTVVCPFCESHGTATFLAPLKQPEIFRRHCDDKLVLHFETGCDLHGSEIKWAVHVPALEFVADFGQMPELELEALWREAWEFLPWENRLERMSTLFEQFESVLCLPSQHSIAAVAGGHDGR
jgi:hypothetical protein